ncbi:MAG: porin family protein [Bacteroidia bacterium]
MKKILTLTFASIFAITAFAQSSSDKKFHFGLEAAPGLYWFKPNTPNNASNGPKLGFSYGVMLEFGFTDNYSFATGLGVASIGGTYTNTTTTAPMNITTTIANIEQLQYLQIPLTLKMKTNAIGLLKYYGQFGLGLGVNLKATDNITTTVGSAPATSTNGSDVQNATNPVRLSLLIGGGVEFNPSGSTALVAGLLFDNGFLNVNKSSSSEILSKGLQLNLGVLF